MLRPIQALLFGKTRPRFSRFKSTCEEECGVEPPRPQAPKYVVEKTCCPSIFESWKPKLPVLTPFDRKAELMRPYAPPKTCTAGMKVPPITRCELEAEAKKREKQCHPMAIRDCPPRTKHTVDGPLPVLRAALMECKQSKGKQNNSKPKSMRNKCPPQVPFPDWDHDGYMA